MTNDPTKKLVLKLLAPAATAEERRQAAIEMHRAVHGSEPTALQLKKLQDVVAKYSDCGKSACEQANERR